MLRSESRPPIDLMSAFFALTTIALCWLCASASAAYVKHADIDYNLDPPDAPAVPSGQNSLDLYVPSGLPTTAHRPVVVFVHGGGWIRGDKGNKPTDKARLFTDAGYIYATINYRLSPVTGDPSHNPGRIKFPDHPHDVGEAIGWLNRNVSEYGGDPGRIVLTGHSAGAHLVSLIGSDPSYLRVYGVLPSQILGVVSLDGIFNIALYADPSLPGRSPSNTKGYQNVFGTVAENAATNSWYDASPINFADPSDPEYLLVTQQGNRKRQAGDYGVAQTLEQDPSSVLLEPLDHEGINDALGNPKDTSGETQAVLGFVQRVVAEASPPVVKIRHRPARIIRTKKRRVRVSFAFHSLTPGVRYKCSLDGGAFSFCHSPRAYTVKVRKHVFRVRALVPGRSHGPTTLTRFRVLRAKP